MLLIEFRSSGQVLNSEAEEVFTIIRAAVPIFCHTNDISTSLVVLGNCPIVRNHRSKTLVSSTKQIQLEKPPVAPGLDSNPKRQRSESLSTRINRNVQTTEISIGLRVWKDDEQVSIRDDHAVQKLILFVLLFITVSVLTTERYITNKTRLMKLLSSRRGDNRWPRTCRIFTETSPRGFNYAEEFFDGQPIVEPDFASDHTRVLEYCHEDILSDMNVPTRCAIDREDTFSSADAELRNASSTITQHRLSPTLKVHTRSDSMEARKQHLDMVYNAHTAKNTVSQQMSSEKVASISYPDEKLKLSMVDQSSPVEALLLDALESTPPSPVDSREKMHMSKHDFLKLTRSQETVLELTPDRLLAQVAAAHIHCHNRNVEHAHRLGSLHRTVSIQT